MSKIPFTVYDFIAYLSSGGVVVATVDYLFGKQWLAAEKIAPGIVLLLLFMSYISGHVVAHFSSLLLEQGLVARVLGRPSKILMGGKGCCSGLFPGYFKALPDETQKRIREKAAARNFEGEGEALFGHVFGVVTKEEAALKRIEEFRNLYGFSRNMAFVFLLTAIPLMVGSQWDKPSSVWWGITAAFVGIVMLYRYLKFFRQFSYRMFLSYSELDAGSGGKG